MRYKSLLLLLCLAMLAGGEVALAQKTPGGVLMSIDSEGNLGDDLDEIAGVADCIVNIDISGVESWDLLDDPDNTLLTEFLGAGTFVTGLGWDLTLTTVGASWLSEPVLYFDGQDLDGIGVFLTPGVDQDMPGSMTFSSGGIIDLTDIGIPNIPIGADGLLYIQFFESFDDVSDAVDAIYGDGSQIDVAVRCPDSGCAGTVCAGPLDIPTLGTIGWMALAILLAAAGVLQLGRRETGARGVP